jgi:hypothetical protein
LTGLELHCVSVYCKKHEESISFKQGKSKQTESGLIINGITLRERKSGTGVDASSYTLSNRSGETKALHRSKTFTASRNYVFHGLPNAYNLDSLAVETRAGHEQ